MANEDEIYDIDPELKTILEGLQPGNITTEIKGMVDVACRCVAILEPWNQARSKHPASEKIIKKVQEDFARFFDVLEKSKDIARNGYKAMEDIAYTCSQLSNPTQSAEQLEIFVNEVSVPVDQADQQSQSIRADFREARTRVIEISKLMPSEVANIVNERNAEIADIKSRKEKMRFIQARTRSLALSLGGTVATSPSATILLPSALDMATLVEKAYRTRFVRKIEERKLHIRRCEDALRMLESVAEFLNQLEECITKFIMFWLRIQEMVRDLKKRIEDLGNLPAAWSIRLELAKKNWEEAAMAYRDYVVMIGYLCIIAPPVRHSDTGGKKVKGLLH